MKDSSLIFDLDRTLFRKNSSFSFYWYLIRKRRMPLASLFKIIPIYFRYQCGELRLTDLHHLVFNAILRGKSLPFFVQEAHSFLDTHLDPLLNSSVYLRFLKGKERGEKTLLLSSSPDFIVRLVANRLGFDHWQATEYAIDKQGRLCEITSLVEGNKKKHFAKLHSFGQTIAYSDSEDDLPLLEWANKAVVVNPNRRLRALAVLRNWEIL